MNAQENKAQVNTKEIEKGLRAYLDKYADLNHNHPWIKNKKIEIRFLGKASVASYFFQLDSPNLAQEITKVVASEFTTTNWKGLYIALNPSTNPLTGGPHRKGLTVDGQIEYNFMLFIDIDPTRYDNNDNKWKGEQPNATAAEKAAAAEKGKEVAEYLEGFGFKNPVQVDSGNGFYLVYHLQQPATDNQDRTTQQIKIALQLLAKKFNDDTAEVDEKVFNPSRIIRIPGTINRKGSGGCDDRPEEALSILIDAGKPDLDGGNWNALKLLAAEAIKEIPKINYQTLVVQNDLPSANNSNEALLKRAIAYALKMRMAVSGWHGHDKALAAVCKIMQKFPTLNDTQVKTVIDEWNARNQPPFSDAELTHKIKAAREKSNSNPYHQPLENRNLQTNHQTTTKPELEERKTQIDLHQGEYHDYHEKTIEQLQITMKRLKNIELMDYKGLCVDVFIEPKKTKTGSLELPAGLGTIRKASDSFIKIITSYYLTFVRYKTDRNTGEQIPKQVDAPFDLIKGISEEPKGLTVLHYLAHGPYLDLATGKLTNTNGMNAGTGKYLVNSVADLEAEIPEQPTLEDAIERAKKLWSVFSEIPWKYTYDEKVAIEDEEFANPPCKPFRPMSLAFVRWLTLLIAQALRLELSTTPLGIITANMPGLGKTLLLSSITKILFGREPSISIWTEGASAAAAAEELNKRLLTLVAGGETFMAIDNVSRVSGADLSNPTLEAFVTSSNFKGRLLGANKEIGGEHRLQVVLTGNGTNPTGDLADRSLFVYLESDDPNRRSKPASEFKSGELLNYITAHRKELLGSVLTIIKAWIIAGKPKPTPEDYGWGSFTDFTEFVVPIVHWSTGINPLKDRVQDIQQTDSKAQARSCLIMNWEKVLGKEPQTASAIIDKVKYLSNCISDIGSKELEAFKESLAELCPGIFKDDLPTAKQFGKALSHSIANQPTYLDEIKKVGKVASRKHHGLTVYAVEFSKPS